MNLIRLDFPRIIGIRQDVPVPKSYAGPGDVVASATGWWGLRAYTRAAIGGNAIRLRESGGNTESNFATIADGGLDLAAITTFKGANNLFVVSLYDQTGNGNTLTQSTAGQQPPFILSGLGSLPVIRYDTDSQQVTLASITCAQPFTVSWVAKRTGNFTTRAGVFGVDGSSPRMGFGNATNLVFTYSNLELTAAATDSAYHAIQAVNNGASSDLNVDGTANTGNASTNSFSAAAVDTNADNVLRADIVEFGLWPTAFSSGQSSAVSSNQRTYWGY